MLVLLLALRALARVARPVAASGEGFQIRIEDAYSKFHSVDKATGDVTGVEA